MVRNSIFTLFVLVLLLSGTASAITASNVEAAVESDLGIGATTTYLDFTNSSTGDAREGLTISQSASGDDWGYPDTSNSAMMVNADSLDDKFVGASDFEVTITGLAANTDYGVYYCVKGRPGDGAIGDVAWGYDSDGAAVHDITTISDQVGAVQLAGDDGFNMYAVPLPGAFTSDATGTLKLWVGDAEEYNTDENTRTQLDGLVITQLPDEYAWNPFPADGIVITPGDIDLSWSAGTNAISHDVYFGTSESAVTNAQRLAGDVNGDGPVDILDLSILAGQWLTDPGSANHSADIEFSGKVDMADFAAVAADWGSPLNAAFIGNQSETTYDPGTLAEDAIYYWRIDEVNASNPDSPWTGTVWSITTAASVSRRLTPEEFVILPWDAPWRPFGPYYDLPTCTTIYDCGFNLAGFVDPDELDNVATAGLKAFVWDWNYVASANNESVLWRTQSEIDAVVASVVSQVGSHPGLFGYFISDEPSPSDIFPGVANWVQTFLTADPDKLAYVSLGWPYDWTNYIPIVQNDFLSYDFYGMLSGCTVNSYYFPVLESARSAAMNSGLPFWNTVASIDMVDTTTPNPANLRFQLYTSLAYGVRGISWFSYFSQGAAAPIQDGNKTNIWYYLRDVNMQMHRIGHIYITLTNVNVFHYPNVPPSQPDLSYPIPSRGISSSNYVQSLSGGDFVVGEFTDPSGNPYIMVVNKSLSQSANVSITFNQAGQIQYVSSVDGQIYPLSDTLGLAPGEGVLLTVQ